MKLPKQSSPLPWRIVPEDHPDLGGALIIDAKGKIVADCNIITSNGSPSEERCFANAELIVNLVNAISKVN